MNISEIKDEELSELATNRLGIIRGFIHRQHPVNIIRRAIDELKEILLEFEDRVEA